MIESSFVEQMTITKFTQPRSYTTKTTNTKLSPHTLNNTILYLDRKPSMVYAFDADYQINE